MGLINEFFWWLDDNWFNPNKTEEEKAFDIWYKEKCREIEREEYQRELEAERLENERIRQDNFIINEIRAKTKGVLSTKQKEFICELYKMNKRKGELTENQIIEAIARKLDKKKEVIEKIIKPYKEQQYVDSKFITTPTRQTFVMRRKIR